jgi:hypothetical protein
MLGVCAGALLLAGCASSDVAGVIGLKMDGNGRVVDGSLDMVAQSTCARLKSLGLQAAVNREGEAIIINSRTPNGNRFNLVLVRDNSGKTGQPEQTRINLKWVDQRDNSRAGDILTWLDLRVAS